MSEQAEDRLAPGSDPSSHRLGAGLGFASGLVLAAWLCLGAPSYLSASSGWTVAWHVAGGILGAFGAAGALVETGKASRADGFGTTAAAVVVATPAGVLHLLQSAGIVAGAVASAFRIVVVVLLLFSLTGVGVAVGKLLFNPTTEARHDPSRAMGLRATGLTIAIIGLAAAALNVLKP